MLGFGAAFGQSSGFTYQGRLTDAGAAANGNYDLQFALWNSLSGGTQVGSTQTINTVAVSNGVFTVGLDFGASSFPGANRFLEISARPSGAGLFTLLTPRQQVTSTPYAVRSANASAADALSGLCSGCVTDTNITAVAGSKITGTIPVNGVPAGSGNYIQNTASQQSSTNFNITGNGTAGGTLSGDIVNTATQYNIGGNRALSIAGTNNTFAGIGAGSANTGGNNSFFGLNAGFQNTTGSSNNFFGHNAGSHNTTGSSNNFFGGGAGLNNTTASFSSFFGFNAGLNNTTGGENSFFGFNAGLNNTTGSENSFFGFNAGLNNTSTGSVNSFFGDSAGLNNTTGGFNSFFGASAGEKNTTGGDNSFFGGSAGVNNTTGLDNSFFGVQAGVDNTTGVRNTFIGGSAGNPFGTQVDDSTAIGRGAKVSTSHTIVLGTSAETTQIPGLGTGGSTSLCRNASNAISTCSSSLRYKTNLAPYGKGMEIINRLRPITFDWKQGGMHDLGFGAEDVERVDPLLTFRNQNGEIEGVKYNQLSAVFVNAFKEQQAQIQTQRDQIAALRISNASLNARLRKIEGTLPKKSAMARRR